MVSCIYIPELTEGSLFGETPKNTSSRILPSTTYKCNKGVPTFFMSSIKNLTIGIEILSQNHTILRFFIQPLKANSHQKCIFTVMRKTENNAIHIDLLTLGGKICPRITFFFPHSIYLCLNISSTHQVMPDGFRLY